MIVAYVGNLSDDDSTPPHSTENHVKQALRNLGHEVVPILERGLDWTTIPEKVKGSDLFLWTRTAGFDPADLEGQANALKSLDTPTAGFHLDRWVGLNREPDVFRSPFFRLDYLFTADGGHDAFWIDNGINHYWSPPAILSNETVLGTYRPDLAADVGFVGNLRKYGHPEWGPYRYSLFKFLTKTYGNRFRLWEGGMRGRDLADLYASVKVLVGDSCLAGGAAKYWSDRVPETLGRGGFLIHPWVEGIDEAFPDLMMYPLGNFEVLKSTIDYWLDDDDRRRIKTVWNREHVLADHLYEHRLARLLSIVLG